MKNKDATLQATPHLSIKTLFPLLSLPRESALRYPSAVSIVFNLTYRFVFLSSFNLHHNSFQSVLSTLGHSFTPV